MLKYVIICLGIITLGIYSCGFAESSNLKMGTSTKTMPKCLKRADSFLGIHFDFHAGPNDMNIGKDVTRAMVENIIEKVKPDFIQCDTKGHPGYSSYPTKVGTPATSFVRDQLRIWRDVTAEHGVALYSHYSGLMDIKAAHDHPEWAVVNPDGTADKNFISVFGPYADNLLIPQLEELRDRYGIDGVWIDGDCWGTRRDYSEKAISEFRKATGIQEIPREQGDPCFFEFTQFTRQNYHRYLKHYVTELHKHDPNFQIASNWAFSSLMPEPADIPVDFISGDTTAQDSVNSARFEGRLLRSQKKTWDIMVWSFSHNEKDGCFITKTVPQIEQEVAAVMSLGGGVQAYFVQQRDGSIYDWQMDTMGEVAKFCRTRQQFCHKAEPVPQIAMLFSSDALYRSPTDIVFHRWGNLLLPLEGDLRAMLDSQLSVEVLLESHLKGRMQEYPLIVIPEWKYFSAEFKSELLSYVNNGGNLLVIGPKSALMFKEQLGVEFQGEAQLREQWLEFNNKLAGLKTVSQSVRVTDKAKAFGKIFFSQDNTKEPIVAASIAEYGNGKIAAMYFNFGELYVTSRTTISRDFLASLVHELFPAPIVEVAGTHNVDVAVNRINGKLAINLLNTSGPHADKSVRSFDEIPEVGPLKISILYDHKPKKVRLEPDGGNLTYKFSDGKVEVVLQKLAIYEIIVVD